MSAIDVFVSTMVSGIGSAEGVAILTRNGRIGGVISGSVFCGRVGTGGGDGTGNCPTTQPDKPIKIPRAAPAVFMDVTFLIRDATDHDQSWQYRQILPASEPYRLLSAGRWCVLWRKRQASGMSF